MLYVYSDASKKGEVLSVGYYIENERKQKVSSGNKLIKVPRSYDSDAAELRALVSAARAVSSEYSNHRIVFITDDDTLPLHIAKDKYKKMKPTSTLSSHLLDDLKTGV